MVVAPPLHPSCRGLTSLLGWLCLIWLVVLSSAACDATQAASHRPSTDGGNAETVAAHSAAAERIARDARWSPGQLQAHFAKHRQEGPYATARAYDASARETIRIGQAFSYVDRTTRARRRGYYHSESNRFTAVTEDGRRITTHFRPESGERYVRNLPESSYR